MELFQNHPLTEEMLRGLGLHELRLLRNEVYARRGRTFGSGWLQQYFEFQPWYEPSQDKREPQLSEIEKKNVEVSSSMRTGCREELRHQGLSGLLEGLFLRCAQAEKRDLRAPRQGLQGEVASEIFLQLRLVQTRSAVQREGSQPDRAEERRHHPGL